MSGFFKSVLGASKKSSRRDDGSTMDSSAATPAAQLRARIHTHLAEVSSPVPEQHLAGLRSLADICGDESSQFIALETKGVIEAFLKAADEGEASESRQLGLIGLVNLASEPENAARLFEAKGVLSSLLKAAQTERDTDIRRSGVLGLASLATAPENMLRMFDTPGVVQAMLIAAQGGETSDIKKFGLCGLGNLAYAPGKKRRLHQTEAGSDSKPGAATSNTGSAESHQQRQRRHSIIANAPDNAVRLLDTNGVVDVMLNAAQNGETVELKQYGLGGLASLAYAPENKARLFKWKGVVEAMLTAAQSGDSNDIVLSGLRGLWSLSKNIAVAESLVEEHNILSLLKHTTSTDESVLSVIYLNFAVAPRARAVLKADVETIERIVKLSQSKVDDRSPVANKLTLAILRGSEGGDKDQLSTDGETFRIILEILDGAITGKEVLYNTWPLNQPLMALRYLTTLESNRAALGTEWLASLPTAVAKGMAQDDPSVVECAMACLSQYALDPTVLPLLQKDAASYLGSAEQVMNKKRDSEGWMSAIRSASGLVFTLKGEGEQRRNQDQTVNERQVMISYAWGPPPHRNKQVAVELESFFESNGFSVWRDEKMMHEDIMVAMAEGVTKSSAVVVLITKTYMESPNCRRELSYAINCKKKIVPLLVEAGYNHLTDGWLGVSIGSLLYHDISSPIQRPAVLSRMIKSEFDVAAEKTQRPLSRRASVRAKRRINSEADVRAWATEVNLPNVVLDGLLKQGYVENDLLEALVDEPASELIKLLHLEVSAHGTKLRSELKKLFTA